MKRLLLSFLILCCFHFVADAQDQELPYVKVNFVIIRSTKDYAAAKATALDASQKLKMKLDLRGLTPSKRTGLTFSKKDCEDQGGYPCYIARGRYDSGEYVSIEWSNEISGFAKGYYVVIVASGDKAQTSISLKKAKPIFADAYSKSAQVYYGCMH